MIKDYEDYSNAFGWDFQHILQPNELKINENLIFTKSPRHYNIWVSKPIIVESVGIEPVELKT